MSSRRQSVAIALGLCVLSVAVFAPVRDHDFVSYDDPVYVTKNPHLADRAGVRGLAWTLRPYETNWIPLTWLSLELDHALHGLDPAGYHLTNLALHTASTLLLFVALAGMSGARWRSAFVAAVFAVHPLHVESVAWVSERKDTLSGLFWMLTLWAYGRYAARPTARRYAGVFAFLSLGLLAKATAVTLPLVLLLLDFWPLRRLGAADRVLDRARVRRAVLEKLPLAVPVAVVSVVTLAVQRAAGAASDLEQISLGLRIETALLAIVEYVTKAFWPSGLAVVYPHPFASGGLGPPLAAAIALLAVSALVLRAARRRPYLAVGWGWFLVTLLPVLGLVQVGLQRMADRYMYVPLVGLAIAVAWGCWDLLAGRRAGRPVAAAFGIASLAALAIAASFQVRVWSDSKTLFSHALRVTEDNYVAHEALGELLLHEGRPDEALSHLTAALRLRPAWAEARGFLADALLEQGRADQALPHYRQALERRPDDAWLHAKYGEALLAQGRRREAIRALERALQLGAAEREAALHALLARAHAETGRNDRAIRHFEAALRLEPDWQEATAALSGLLVQEGRAEEAYARLERALRVHPEAAGLHVTLGDVEQRLGRPQRARERYETALRLEPGSLLAANNLAWLLATHPDPRLRDADAAVRLAERAAATSGRQEPNVLDTLAVSYAAAGRFEDALATLDAALALARARRNAALVAALEGRRRTFLAGQPFLEGEAAADG